MRKTVLIIITGAFLVTSCGRTEKHKETEEQSSKVETANDNHSTETAEESILTLNKGEKWIANAETTKGVNNMIRVMNVFSGENNLEAYVKLQEDLQSEFEMIFKKCTMRGEAHNQLHHFLMPIQEWLKTLNSTDISTCKTSRKYLQNHLNEYKEFFK